jgi:hypothetical protein
LSFFNTVARAKTEAARVNAEVASVTIGNEDFASFPLRNPDKKSVVLGILITPL